MSALSPLILYMNQIIPSSALTSVFCLGFTTYSVKAVLIYSQ